MQKEKVIVKVELTDNNYASYIEILPGCVATGKTFDEMKKNMQDAVIFHLEGSREDGDEINPAFDNDNYELVFKFNTQSLLQHYKGIFTNTALRRLTGINERQLQRYASGESEPRPEQSQKIADALHKLGNELLVVEL